MGTVTLHPLLLLLFGCFQGAISQSEWLEEVEGSGKTSNNVSVMLFFQSLNERFFYLQWVQFLWIPTTTTSFLVWA